MNEEELIELLSDFWDWMHDEWHLSSLYNGCALANDDISFKEYALKYLEQKKEEKR